MEGSPLRDGWMEARGGCCRAAPGGSFPPGAFPRGRASRRDGSQQRWGAVAGAGLWGPEGLGGMAAGTRGVTSGTGGAGRDEEREGRGREGCAWAPRRAPWAERREPRGRVETSWGNPSRLTAAELVRGFITSPAALAEGRRMPKSHQRRRYFCLQRGGLWTCCEWKDILFGPAKITSPPPPL